VGHSRSGGHSKVTDYPPPHRRTLEVVPSALAPRLWWGHLLALVLVAAAATLGFWQLEAWQERRAAEARDLTRTEPVPLTDVLGPDDPFPGDRVGQPVTVSGTWLADGTVFVSGRERHGTDGYWMVTPLGLTDGAAIPVVLGWLAAPDAAPAPPVGDADVVGWLQPSEGSGAVDEDPSDDVVPQLRAADLVQLVDQDLYGAYAVARDGIAGLPAADLAALPEASRFTAVRNLLYGVEWWVFGGFALFIWWRWLRDSTQLPDEESAGDAAPDTVSA
jgi:surfeit locus 1 family protein